MVVVILAVIIKRRCCIRNSLSYCNFFIFSPTTFIIVVLSIITLAVLMSLAVAVVMSAGLSKTCKALRDTGLHNKFSDIRYSAL